MRMDSLISALLFGGQMNTLSQIFRVLVALFFGYFATNFIEQKTFKFIFWVISFFYLYLALSVELINAVEYYAMR